MKLTAWDNLSKTINTMFNVLKEEVNENVLLKARETIEKVKQAYEQ